MTILIELVAICAVAYLVGMRMIGLFDLDRVAAWQRIEDWAASNRVAAEARETERARRRLLRQADPA